VLSAYLLALVVLTSWPKLRFRRRVWRAIHLTSIPAGVLAAMHAYQAGSDRPERWFQVLLAVLAGLLVYAAVLRLDAVRRRSRDRAERRAKAGGRFSPNS
jgi:DMSO/TMAO reductase YedYZ heme-binding membrane subunit